METFIAQLHRAFGSKWFSSRDVLSSMRLKDAASRAAGKLIKFRITLATLMETATGTYETDGKRLRIETGQTKSGAVAWRVVEVDRDGARRWPERLRGSTGS